MPKFNRFPRSAKTNYNRLRPFLDAVDAQEEKQFTFHAGDAFMPLSIEYLHEHFDGMPVYSIMHYFIQEGDLMRDPDVTFAVDREGGRILPLTFRQDGCSFAKYGTLYHEVFPNPSMFSPYIPSYLASIDSFLRTWTQNIIDQGFSPDEPSRAAAPDPDAPAPVPLPVDNPDDGPVHCTYEEFVAAYTGR